MAILDKSGGPRCKCFQGNKLKRMEDMRIIQKGKFVGQSGLKSRVEMLTSVRVQILKKIDFVNFVFVASGNKLTF